jgi:Holliday junction resolvasome RuvABC ATP-dependent DNA helicase subunit
MKIKIRGLAFDYLGSESKQIGEILVKPHFNDVVYSDKQKEFMKLVLDKIKGGEQINLLFSGYAGTGKTYSSQMIACETNKPYIYISGNQSKNKILEILNNANNSVVCIDEIHGMRDNVAELIYPLIEYGELYIDSVKKNLNSIFICTTTEPEKLPKPLQDRLMRIEFDEPDEKMTKQILKKMGLNDKCITHLINYTLNIRILKKLIKYMDLYGERDLKNLIKVFNMMKINWKSGLSEEQENYINYLKKVKKASVRNLSLVLRRSENYIKLDIEPDLIRKELIMITSKGRELQPSP